MQPETRASSTGGKCVPALGHPFARDRRWSTLGMAGSTSMRRLLAALLVGSLCLECAALAESVWAEEAEPTPPPGEWSGCDEKPGHTIQVRPYAEGPGYRIWIPIPSSIAHPAAFPAADSSVIWSTAPDASSGYANDRSAAHERSSHDKKWRQRRLPGWVGECCRLEEIWWAGPREGRRQRRQKRPGQGWW